MIHRRVPTRIARRAIGLAAASLVVVACGGGGDAAPTSTGDATGTTIEGTSAGGDAVAPGDDHGADDHGAGDDPAGDDLAGGGHATDATITVSKQQFDELRLQVLELAVEVDKLQTLAGLGTDGEAPAPAPVDEPDAEAALPAWSYEDAERWDELADEFDACGAGVEQSPIDLTGAVGRDLPNAVSEYVPADATIVDTGRTVEIAVPEAGSLELDGISYSFVRLHFHAPSEHTVGGEHWPMEWHFVHRADDGGIAVIGVLVEEGTAHPGFDAIIDSLPTRQGVEDIVYGQVDVDALLPDLRAAFRYDGSLTTPPCTEGVAWSVLQATITMSAEQMAAFTDRLDAPNVRPVQPIGDRGLDMDLSA